MNNIVRQLIKPKAGRYLGSKQDVLLLAREVNKRAEVVFPVILDIGLIKDMINTTFELSASNVKEQMKLTGWEGLVGASDLNEQMQGLMRNPAIILYTQMLLGIAIPLVVSEPLNLHPEVLNQIIEDIKASEEQQGPDLPQ